MAEKVGPQLYVIMSGDWNLRPLIAASKLEPFYSSFKLQSLYSDHDRAGCNFSLHIAHAKWSNRLGLSPKSESQTDAVSPNRNS